jgi:glycosyltransferase involved in cell wall biosynthesis
LNILHLTPDFNYTDGRSYYVFLLLKYLKKEGHNVCLLTNGGDSADRLEELKIPVLIKKQLSDKFSFVKSLKFIKEAALNFNADIIHSHHRYYELLANTAAISLKRKLRTVFTALSIVDNRYSVEYKSDRIIAVSNSVKSMLANKFKVDTNKISLIPNFADSEEINFSGKITETKLNSVQNEINILSVGRFHKEKDHITLLKAIEKLKDKSISLTIAGEGEGKDSYLEFINSKSLNVKLVAPQKDLSDLYNNADICVLSSIRDPFPTFMLQSGLYKKAFIGTDIDGISELIISGENGLLFQKKNYNELAGRINLFTDNQSLAEKCGNNLFRAVKENYTEKKIIPEIIELYKTLI